MSKEEYVGNGLWKQCFPNEIYGPYSGYQPQSSYDRQTQMQTQIQRDLGLLPEPIAVDAAQSGVFVELVGGKPVVSIRCSDSSKLDELTALARRIMDSIR